MDDFKAASGESGHHCCRCVRLSGASRKARRRLRVQDQKRIEAEAPRRIALDPSRLVSGAELDRALRL